MLWVVGCCIFFFEAVGRHSSKTEAEAAGFGAFRFVLGGNVIFVGKVDFVSGDGGDDGALEGLGLRDGEVDFLCDDDHCFAENA